MSMQIVDTKIDGCKILIPHIHIDKRGSFLEIWNSQTFLEIGVKCNFVQDNISTSSKGVLRGLHTQMKYPQAKMVSCLHGVIFDVVVDCRPGSPSFGMWHGEILSHENHKQLFVPKGVAHGFYIIEEAMVHMKVTTHYTPGDEIGFKWDDKSIGIDWPLNCDSRPILAEKDKNWGDFNEMMILLERYRT